MKLDLEDRDALVNKIESLIEETFRNKKVGYMWLEAKFGTVIWDYFTLHRLKEMILCIYSKKKLVICPLHGRIHQSLRNRRKEKMV